MPPERLISRAAGSSAETSARRLGDLLTLVRASAKRLAGSSRPAGLNRYVLEPPAHFLNISKRLLDAVLSRAERADIPTSNALTIGERPLRSLERWQGLAKSTSRTNAPAATGRHGQSQALNERQASVPGGDRRGSLGFVDQMFTDAEGYELNSVLCDWEQHLTNLRGTADTVRTRPVAIKPLFRRHGE